MKMYEVFVYKVVERKVFHIQAESEFAARDAAILKANSGIGISEEPGIQWIAVSFEDN